MTDLLVLAVGLSLFMFGIDYLRREFGDTHPEFLPFLRGLRWIVLVLGIVLGIAALISALGALF